MPSASGRDLGHRLHPSGGRYLTISSRSLIAALLSCGLAACGSSSSGSDSNATGAGGASGSNGQASGGGKASGGTSAAGAGGSAGAGAAGGGAGGQSSASCKIPADANSCVSSGGQCQSFWGAYTAAIVMQSCPAPNTFLAGPCPTDALAAVCVYGSNPAAGNSLNVPATFPPAQQAGLKSQCEAGMGTWCPL